MLEKIKDILLKNEKIINAFVFGSYANGKNYNLSDIDIAIEVSDGFDLVEHGLLIVELEEAVNKKVDVVVINELYKKSPLLSFNIYKNHKVLFVKDKDRYVKFCNMSLHFYLDFKPVLDEQNRKFLER